MLKKVNKKQEINCNNEKIVNNKKFHFNIKKNLGRLIALIIVISMLLATSATLIFYAMYYLG